MRIDRNYQTELLKRLYHSQSIKKEISLLNRFSAKRPLCWLIEGTRAGKVSSLTSNLLCPLLPAGKRKSCLGSLNRAIRKAKKSRHLTSFTCPKHLYGLCLPLIQGDALYGFLILCHLKALPPEESLHLLETLNATILEKLQKELELSKLYQTIRPRAVALSTIHTIHRLISSTLNLDELLPRIARLSLQVLRARRCLISLIDKETRRLVPKALIDLSRRKERNLRTSAIERKIEQKVLSTGNISLSKSHLALPLIDEAPIGAISVFGKMDKRTFDNFDREILTALAEQAVGAIKNAQLYKEQENTLFGTVKSLSALLKVKADYSYSRSGIFADIVLGIAQELRLSDEDSRDLHLAAMLHDAEKIGIPEEILKKQAHLTGKELKIVKEHPKKSAKMLSPLQRLKPAITIILHHHEKFDGTGYPDKLKGEKIPLGSRIMTVADAFEAMISRRPYRKPTSISEAIGELKRHSGTQFDPQVLKAFITFTKSEAFKKLIKGLDYARFKKSLRRST